MTPRSSSCVTHRSNSSRSTTWNDKWSSPTRRSSNASPRVLRGASSHSRRRLTDAPRSKCRSSRHRCALRTRSRGRPPPSRRLLGIRHGEIDVCEPHQIGHGPPAYVNPVAAHIARSASLCHASRRNISYPADLSAPTPRYRSALAVECLGERSVRVFCVQLEAWVSNHQPRSSQRTRPTVGDGKWVPITNTLLVCHSWRSRCRVADAVAWSWSAIEVQFG